MGSVSADCWNKNMEMNVGSTEADEATPHPPPLINRSSGGDDDWHPAGWNTAIVVGRAEQK